jgi:hypothetical protein
MSPGNPGRRFSERITVTNTGEVVKIFLLGMIVAFLAVIALRPQDNSALAAGGADRDGALMGLTGDKEASLFLVDPVNKQIAQYSIKNNNFSLRAARSFKHDLSITEVNNQGGLSVEKAEDEARKSAKAEK